MSSTTGAGAHALFVRAAAVLGVSLGFGVVFDLLFFEKLPGVSFPLYMLLVLSGIFVSARYFKTVIPRNAQLLMLPLLFFSGMVAVRAGGFVTFLNFVTSLYLLVLVLQAIYVPDIRSYRLGGYIRPLFEVTGRCLERLRRTLGEFTAARSVMRRHPALPQILRGVLIAVPVLFVFVLLFSSADLVFRKAVEDVFSFHVSDTAVAHTILVLMVTAACTGLFGYLMDRPTDAAMLSDDKLVKKRGGAIEASILFGSLNVLFLLFILVQLAYFFGGEQNVLGQGFTYAQYARKGFFELIVVAVLTFLLIMGAQRMLLAESGRHERRFRLLAAGLTVQVLVIMVSAFKRLSLYESAYGFTSLRVLSHLFIIWLAFVFGLLLYKLFVDQRDSTFAFRAFLSVMVFLAIINIGNVDAFVARKNIGRYYSTHRLDVGHLGQLSDDAIVDTVKLLDGPDPELREALAGTLYQKRLDLEEKHMHWQSANLTRSRALRALQSHSDLLERNKDKRVEGLSRPVGDASGSTTE